MAQASGRHRAILGEMAETDRTRLDEFHQMVRTWVWVLDNPMDALGIVRQSNLDVIRNQIHRERSALIDSGEPYNEQTMRLSDYVLPKIDRLISDRDNKRGIFA